MAVIIPDKSKLVPTQNIIIGHGEVPAVPGPNGICWALPGDIITSSRKEAVKVAERLDRMIRANLALYSRRIFP